jgi:hypothetical protein
MIVCLVDVCLEGIILATRVGIARHVEAAQYVGGENREHVVNAIIILNVNKTSSAVCR